MRDITLNDTFRHGFSTRAFATGIPTTLAGSPIISVHEEANDTFITAGITLDTDIGASPVTGLHEVTIIATTGNGYEAGKSYTIFISTGTVGGVSVVGEAVGHFTVALSAAAVDLANVTDGLTALRTLLLDIPTVGEFNARTIVSANYFDPAADDVDVRAIQANVITAASINAAAFAAAKFGAGFIVSGSFGLNAIDSAALAASAANEIRDAILDELTASHVGAGSVGEVLNNLPNDGALTFLDASILARTLPTALYFDPAADDVDVRSLQANVINTAAFAAAAITNAKIASNAFVNAAFDTNCIGAAQLAPNCITSTQIATNAIGAAQLAGGAIAASKFAINAISAAAFAADAITATVLAASAAQKIRDEILPTQNAAFNNLEFLFVAASDHVTPVTAATVISATRSIDGGAFVAVAGSIAEVGNGIYSFDALAADMNGGTITFRFIATGGTPGAPDDTFVTIITGGGV